MHRYGMGRLAADLFFARSLLMLPTTEHPPCEGGVSKRVAERLYFCFAPGHWPKSGGAVVMLSLFEFLQADV